MRLLFSASVAGVVMAGALTALAQTNVPAAAAGGTPAIYCAEPTFAFGQLDNTQVVTHTFILTNRGKGPLSIGNVRASCGCTVATVSKRQVPPGENTEVTARLNLAGRRGEQHKDVTVESNDPAQPQYKLWLQGVAMVEIGLEPAYVNFGQITTGGTRQSNVQLLSKRPDVELTSVTGMTERFGAEIVRDANGRARELVVRAVPPFPAGFTRTDLVLGTTHPQTKELRLPVSALVPEPVLVVPRWVLVRGPAGSAPVRRALLVRPGGVQKFSVLRVEVPDPRITAVSESLGPSNYRVTLTDIPIDAALHGKQIVIVTDAPGAERLGLEIRVTLDPPPAPGRQN